MGMSVHSPAPKGRVCEKHAGGCREAMEGGCSSNGWELAEREREEEEEEMGEKISKILKFLREAVRRVGRALTAFGKP